ncbi:Uncharacterised protein [Mycobacterium tuberculosis]|nr:Uncharacterised protein [Mycobacterium tuberculosis]
MCTGPRGMLAKARNAESILLRALAIDSMDTEQRQNRRKVAPRPSPSSLVSCCECRGQHDLKAGIAGQTHQQRIEPGSR